VRRERAAGDRGVISHDSRIVCNFSSGAASAVATKLILGTYGLTHEIEIVNAFLKEEHEDNRRFLHDCEAWFARPITVLRDEKYGASAREVFRRKRYLKGLRGAPCSGALKRDILEAFQRPGDTTVLGYTADTADTARWEHWQDSHNELRGVAPLIEAGLTKSDVLAMVERQGLVLPLMYRLGFHNANCIGCVKGGEGYWNKIRKHFPAAFEEMAQIEQTIGYGAFLFRIRSGPLKGQRFSLRELKPDAGRYQDEPSIECGASCEMAEESPAWDDLT